MRIPDGGTPATALAWSADSKLLIIGRGDGAVSAFAPDKGPQWEVTSPLAASVKTTAVPNQAPQGTVLQIAPERDGGRFAVIRQDVREIDIYALSDGRRLLALTPPSNVTPIPVTASFERGGLVIASWTLHFMTRQTPLYVTAHRLPRTLDEEIAAAEARLGVYVKAWSPEGPPPSGK